MNKVKRLLGPVWIAIAIVAVIYLIKTAAAEIAKRPGPETKIQWAVFVIVALPVAAGLVCFGYFAFKGEYNE